MNDTGAADFRSIIEAKIRKKNNSVKPDEQYARALYLILRKLKGHSLADVLQMDMPQFYWILDAISEEIDLSNKAYEKAKRKK